MPRPKLTKEDIAKAEELKSAGVLDKDIAAYIGVRADAFSKWVNHPKSDNQRQLSQALKRVEANYKANLLKIIYNNAAEKTWQAAAWLLERKYPDEFARTERVKADAKVEQVPQIVDDV